MVGRAPRSVTDLLDTNPIYVFFKLGKPGTSGSKGSMGRRITPWVSVATDQSVLPNGLLTLMNVTLPDEGGEHSVPFNALTLPAGYGRGDQAQPRGSVLRQRRNGDAHGQLSGQPGSGVSAASSIGF